MASKFKGTAKYDGQLELDAGLSKKDREKLLKSIEKTIRKKLKTKQSKVSKKELKKIRKLIRSKNSKSRLKSIVRSEIRSIKSLINRRYDRVNAYLSNINSQLGDIREDVARILDRMDDTTPPDDLTRWREMLRENLGETVIIRTIAGTVSGEVTEVGEDYVILNESNETTLVIPLYNIESVTVV